MPPPSGAGVGASAAFAGPGCSPTLLTVPSRPTTLSRFSNLRRKSDLTAAGMLRSQREEELSEDLLLAGRLQGSCEEFTHVKHVQASVLSLRIPPVHVIQYSFNPCKIPQRFPSEKTSTRARASQPSYEMAGSMSFWVHVDDDTHVPHDLIERLMTKRPGRLLSPLRRSFSPLLVPVEAQRLQAPKDTTDAGRDSGADNISATGDSSNAGSACVSEAVSEDDEGQHCYTLAPGFAIYIDSPCRQRYAASDDGSDESDEEDEDSSPAARRWILGEVNDQRRLGPEPRG